MKMKLKRSNVKMTALAAMSLGLSPSAFGEVDATKSAGLWDSVQVHSTMYLNHRIDTVREKNETEDKMVNNPKIRFMPLIGAKLFDETLDAYFLGYYDHKPQTTTFQAYKQSRFYLEHKGWNVTDNFTIQPMAVHYIADKIDGKSKAGQTLLASAQTLSAKYSTGAGSFTPSMGVELGAFFTNKGGETSYQGKDGAAVSSINTDSRKDLRSETDDQGNVTIYGDKKHPDFYHEWYAGLTYVPSALPELSINGTIWYTNDVVPEYSASNTEKNEVKYVVKKSTTDRLRIVYKVTDQLSLRNDFLSYHDGFYQKGKSGKSSSFVNELGIVYTVL